MQKNTKNVLKIWTESWLFQNFGLHPSKILFSLFGLRKSNRKSIRLKQSLPHSRTTGWLCSPICARQALIVNSSIWAKTEPKKYFQWRHVYTLLLRRKSRRYYSRCNLSDRFKSRQFMGFKVTYSARRVVCLIFFGKYPAGCLIRNNCPIVYIRVKLKGSNKNITIHNPSYHDIGETAAVTAIDQRSVRQASISIIFELHNVHTIGLRCTEECCILTFNWLWNRRSGAILREITSFNSFKIF